MNITEAVKEVIQHRIFILDAMRLGLINYSALSEYLQEEVKNLVGTEVKVLSISMALRRYNVNLAKDSIHDVPIDDNTDLMSKSNLVEFTIRKHDAMDKRLKQLQDEIANLGGDFLTSIQGSSNVVILLKRTYSEVVQRIFRRYIVITKDHLGAIFMGIPGHYRNEPGFFYRLTRELAINNINLLSVANIDTEVLFVLNEPDVPRAFQLLYQLIQGN